MDITSRLDYKEHGSHPTYPLFLPHLLLMMEDSYYDVSYPTERPMWQGTAESSIQEPERNRGSQSNNPQELNSANNRVSKLGSGSSLDAALDETCYELNV